MRYVYRRVLLDLHFHRSLAVLWGSPKCCIFRHPFSNRAYRVRANKCDYCMFKPPTATATRTLLTRGCLLKIPNDFQHTNPERRGRGDVMVQLLAMRKVPPVVTLVVVICLVVLHFLHKKWEWRCEGHCLRLSLFFHGGDIEEKKSWEWVVSEIVFLLLIVPTNNNAAMVGHRRARCWKWLLGVLFVCWANASSRMKWSLLRKYTIYCK